MKILALGTSGSNCTACILADNQVICDMNLAAGITHSETLLPMIEEINKSSQIDLSEIDVLSCSIGPGSFTGLRIGIATIKGFALSLSKKVIGIPTLLGLAYNIPYFDGLICSVLDAKNNNVYAGIYRYENHIPILQEDYFTESVDGLIEFLNHKDEKVIFVGDGAITYRENFQEFLKEKAFFAPVSLHRELASSIAMAAFDKAMKNEYDDFNTLNPMYLKKSQAERMLDGDDK